MDKILLELNKMGYEYTLNCKFCSIQSNRIAALFQDISISISKIYVTAPRIDEEDVKKRIKFILCGPIDNDCNNCNKVHKQLEELEKTI